MAFDASKGQNHSCQINEKGDQYVECTECGATAEIGTVIVAGDDVLDSSISAETPENVKNLFDKYLALAQSITDELEYTVQDSNEGKTKNFRFKFGCTAEKMIFEMRVRSIK